MIGRIRTRQVLAAVACGALVAGLLVSKQSANANRDGANAGATPRALAGATPSPPTRRPNIVFVLTDDLAMNLIRYMPAVLGMEQAGMTFDNYFVSDSLCCPSRASIFTGNFPHDTMVLGNQGPNGGFGDFYRRGEQNATFATALQKAGYRTAMMGKFLNGYLDRQEGSDGVPDGYVPPGWNEWDVAGWGYPEFNYEMNENGTIHDYGNQPQDYLTDVIAGKGVDFINSSASAGQPFFLELGSFAPHWPYTPAPRYANAFPGVTAPEAPSFDQLPTNPPSWLAGRPPLSAADVGQINNAFRERVQAVQAINDMIYKVEQTLAADGLSNNTYIVFSSDNGLHMGEYRLMPGKMTAFDTDIHVPLVVIGPGVPANTHTDAMAENIDLAKTFTAIGGTSLPSDGHSLLDVLHGVEPTDWRNAVLVEHHGPNLDPLDPDFQYSASGNPITYEAMRTNRFLYVEYVNGEREFYDLATDPNELQNIAGQLPPGELAQLHQELVAMASCHDGASCWAAMHVGQGSAVATQLRRRADAAGRGGLHKYRYRGLRHRGKLDRKRGAFYFYPPAVPQRNRGHDRQAKSGPRTV
jgi:arylsulfatase A-like enzyme